MQSASKLFVSTVVLAMAGFASAAAFAQENLPTQKTHPFFSQQTRAEVQADVLQAVAGHRFVRHVGAEHQLESAAFTSTKTRAQVIAETREAARLGLILRNADEVRNAAPSAQQLRLIAQAGERAISTQVVGR